MQKKSIRHSNNSAKGIELLRKHFLVKVYPKDQVVPKRTSERNKNCDALLCLLTNKIDKQVINANPTLKIISNYAVGYDNVDVKTATKKGIPVTNTPGVLTDAVAEHTFALMMYVAKRIPESDQFMRQGRYKGWKPMLLLGTELKGKLSA